MLLPPHIVNPVTIKNSLFTKILVCLATQYNKTVGTIRCHVSVDEVEVWGKVQVVDGDTIVASSLVRSSQEDSRNASYVWVSFVYIFHLSTFNLLYSKYQLLIDKNAQLANTEPLFIPETFYGQLQHIFVINMPAAQQLGIPNLRFSSLALFSHWGAEWSGHALLQDTWEDRGCWHYNRPMSCGSCQGLWSWAIIDRSSNLARATFELDWS